MNIDIEINEIACFYYWVQAISGWNVYAPEKSSYDHYQGIFYRTATKEQKRSAERAAEILKHAKNPYKILEELYTNTPNLRDTIEIITVSKTLEALFRPLFKDIQRDLLSWQDKLQNISSSIQHDTIDTIGRFLNTSFNTQNPCTVFLIQSAPHATSVGHVIRGTSFILLHPSQKADDSSYSKTLSTIIHEYLHLLEFHSSTTERLFKQSYEKLIKPRDIKAPAGYTWRMIYSETIAYCFANNITGGYFRPETYQKNQPTVIEMQKGFNNLIESKNHTTNDIIAWVALNILPDVKEYLESDRVIDAQLADKISRYFLSY